MPFSQKKCHLIAIIAGISIFIFITQNSYAQENESLSSGKFNNLLKLTATGNGYSDQTIVVFNPQATPGFDPQFDAYKLQGSNAAPQLYSIIPGINLSINALPEILINLDVQLGFKVGFTNNYVITATELTSFDASVTIYLYDTKDSVLIDLKTNPVYSFIAAPGDNIQRFKLYFRYPVQLNVRVFLEGNFNETEMNTLLNSGNYLPLNQPFNSSPWNYGGTESVSVIPNPDIVDWVLIEIRDTLSPSFASSSTTVEKAAGFLLKNGSIVGMDGISFPIFKETISDSIFVVVWHRNHLGLISSAGPEESEGIYSYDFTTGIDKAFGGSSALKELAPGIFGMIAGDYNADGIINDLDKSGNWMPQSGTTGYLMGDGNMDGQVNNPDKNDLWLNNQNLESQVPD
jgi:hypothetical protein